ncbi:hypothetical protein D3C85_1941880 [compost metagenome]
MRAVAWLEQRCFDPKHDMVVGVLGDRFDRCYALIRTIGCRFVEAGVGVPLA